MEAPAATSLKDAKALPQESDVIAVISGLVHQLKAEAGQGIVISKSSRLDRDLGIDSLARAELLLRLEEVFQTRVPKAIITDAETVGDITAALGKSEWKPESVPSSQ